MRHGGFHRGGAVSILTLLLSSDNLLTGYDEQLSYSIAISGCLK